MSSILYAHLLSETHVQVNFHLIASSCPLRPAIGVTGLKRLYEISTDFGSALAQITSRTELAELVPPIRACKACVRLT